MPRIRLLDGDLANQIAAGEVVERPSSVVKELVENALDAGATRVQVDLEEGGLSLVRVTDDGEGMDREDARMAFERHATSKISAFDDLMRLQTFGFRGEALPSIASVSRLTLRTRTKAAVEGTEVTLEGGGAPRVRPAGHAPGTSVEVRDLFFNVPARRKFLKASSAESAHVGEVVLMAALARPDVTFVLTRDGRPAREYLRVASRKERARQIALEERLESCVAARGPMTLEAYLAPPERARAGSVALHLLVNGRPVKDRPLARAVAQAFGSVLEAGRYPVGTVYVDLPPGLVDVNVHPQKAEVRFADARSIYDAVTRELHLTLAKAFALPTGPLFRSQVPPRGPAGQGPAPQSGQWRFAMAEEPDPWGLAVSASPGALDAFASPPEPIMTVNDAEPELFEPKQTFAGLTFLAQVRLTFLVCEGRDGLYILDQHAAAERVTFDRLRRAYAAKAVPMQRMLVPEVVELAPAEIATLEENTEAVQRLGLELRAVGAQAIAVHGVPRLLLRASPERLVRDVVAEVGRAAARPFGDAADLVLATMACHGSVRAGDRMSREEATALLAALDEVDFAGHCPHGRPVVTRLGWSELERSVGRP